MVDNIAFDPMALAMETLTPDQQYAFKGTSEVAWYLTEAAFREFAINIENIVEENPRKAAHFVTQSLSLRNFGEMGIPNDRFWLPVILRTAISAQPNIADDKLFDVALGLALDKHYKIRTPALETLFVASQVNSARAQHYVDTIGLDFGQMNDDTTKQTILKINPYATGVEPLILGVYLHEAATFMALAINKQDSAQLTKSQQIKLQNNINIFQQMKETRTLFLTSDFSPGKRLSSYCSLVL